MKRPNRYGAGVVAMGVAAGGLAVSSDARIDGRRSSLVQRTPVTAPSVDETVLRVGTPAVFPLEFRTIDGVGNNPINPTWGAAGAMLVRKAPNEYANLSDDPARPDCISAREISNIIASQTVDAPNPAYASDYLWQWGQFLDHDIDETPVGDPVESFDIPVAPGDPWFDPDNTGTVMIPLDRSAGMMDGGVRQQINNITAFIDASNVYGSDQTRADTLRAFNGLGYLKVSAGALLPFNTTGLPNAPTGADPSLFLAGDVRANEQVGLTAMHTLFVREHNYWARRIRRGNPSLTGDEIYEHARAMVAAELQAITYNEFLPLLLGPDALAPYSGYDESVNPGIANEFATVGYRVGHTMLSPQIRRIDRNGAEISAGHLPLASAFFTPVETIDHGIDPVLRGLASQRAQNIDTLIIDDVRNFLFGPPGAGGFDLAALNIQRGRDHGMPSYNGMRVCYGLAPVTSFAEINSDPTVEASLAAAYADPDDIDPWIGLLAESHKPGALVGETLHRLLVKQFEDLRDGDRFWYESYLPPHMVALVNDQKLSTIIRRNTGIGFELQENVFRLTIPCVADIDGSGVIDAADLATLLASWGLAGTAADLDFDGTVGGSDIALLLSQWGTCP